ncbi:MAG: hypothetical protein HYV53_03420 [Parcubacteria group bacterium]|nr:hypothetical protein [Parcubacteria group bacterium]
MLFRKEKPLPSAETPAEPEITPEHSAETLKMVEQIDYGIADSENLLNGLGRLAREKIITNPETLEEIYAPKEIGQLGLKKYDTSAFELAGIGLRIRNAINFGQYKYALKGEEGLVDTRKLRQEATGNKYDLMEWNGELVEVAKELGLNPEEINRQDFSKIYVAGEKGKSAEKTILQRKTEQEMDKIASNILEKQLKDLETKTGPELIKERLSLEGFKKEIEQLSEEQNDGALSAEDLARLGEEKEIEQLSEEQNDGALSAEDLARLGEEKVRRQGLIDEKQASLNTSLEYMRPPLLDQQRILAGAIEGFLPLMAEAAGREKSYEQEIKGIQDKIRKFRGAKQIAEFLGDKVTKWEEQKKQVEINLKDFRQKKEALDKRLAALKKNKAEVDATIIRIDNIGKIKEELKTEKQEKIQEETQKKSTVAGAAGRPITQITEEEARQWQDAGWQGRIPYEELGGDIDNNRKTAAQAENTAAKKKTPIKPAVPKSENNPLANPAETEQEDKEKITKQVSRWLDLLGIRNAVGPAEAAVKNNFKESADKEFDPTASLTLEQVRQAYIKYLIDFQYSGKKVYLARARDVADEKLKIIEQKL